MICTWRKYKTPAGAITKMLATSVRLWEENLQWKVRKVKPTKVERERHYHFHTTFGEAKPHWYTTSRPATGHLASKYPVGLCHKTCTIKIHQSIERPSTSASRHYLTHTHLQGAFITVLELGKMQCNMYTSQHGHRQNFVLRRANPLYEGEEGGGAGQLCWGGWGGGGKCPFCTPLPTPMHHSEHTRSHWDQPIESELASHTGSLYLYKLAVTVKFRPESHTTVQTSTLWAHEIGVFTSTARQLYY